MPFLYISHMINGSGAESSSRCWGAKVFCFKIPTGFCPTDGDSDIVHALQESAPISLLMKERIDALRAWAHHRCRFVDKPDDEQRMDWDYNSCSMSFVFVLGFFHAFAIKAFRRL